jgi:hypothetical protein
MVRKLALLVALVGMLAGMSLVRGAENKMPDEVKAVLEKADSLELVSLEPAEEDKSDKGLYGWKVLGKTEIKEAEGRKKVVDALLKGVSESDGKAARCFIPRHAVRAKQGDKAVELVICFECAQIRIYTGKDDNKPAGVTVTPSPEATFDEVLKAAGVPLAAKTKPKD